jgi:hypothetical protein
MVHGFDVLSQYDSNQDGMINQEDTMWRELLVWQFSGAQLEGHYSDPDESGKLLTLSELGIMAISLDATFTGLEDDAGNTEISSSRIEWADGRVGIISEYSFQRDTMDTIPTDFIEIP